MENTQEPTEDQKQKDRIMQTLKDFVASTRANKLSPLEIGIYNSVLLKLQSLFSGLTEHRKE